MLSGIWGKKIGITQLFYKDKVVPVTAIDVGNWVVTNIKTEDRDGYNALQVGRVRNKYVGEKPLKSWLKNLKQYFTVVREIKVDASPEGISLGDEISFYDKLKQGGFVDVFGISKGRGFAGVVKRHGFAGPPASHGATMGKKPGSIGHLTASGRVFKGKSMPGHLGAKKTAMKNLEVVEIKSDGPVIFVKGSIPGHTGSLVFIRKV